MPININGYNIYNNSGLYFGASTTRVDSSGRLISPNLPAMYGSRTGTTTQSRQWPWALNSMFINVNTCYSGSTYLFTAPVAGIYYTSWSGIGNATGSATATTTSSGYVCLAINGGAAYFTHWNTNDTWDTQNLECLIKLAAGDTIGYAVNISPAPDSGSGLGAYADNHNQAVVWLVG